jgi:mevalonate kinase
MRELAAAARDAAVAIERGDTARVAELVDATWRIRSSLGAVAPAQAALIEAARHAGMAATSAGSGGSIVAVVDDPERVETFSRRAPHASSVRAST